MISFAPMGIPFLIAVLVYFLLGLTLSIHDGRRGLLPDSLTFSLLWLGLLFHCFFYPTKLPSAVIGAVSGYLSLWILYWAFYWLRQKEGLGYGDFKLLAAVGAWNGWQSLGWVLMLASAAGLMGFTVLRIIQGKWRAQLPFGPFLAMAGWGEFIWQLK